MLDLSFDLSAFLFSQVTDTALISVDCWQTDRYCLVIQEIGKSSAIKFYIKSKEIS